MCGGCTTISGKPSALAGRLFYGKCSHDAAVYRVGRTRAGIGRAMGREGRGCAVEIELADAVAIVRDELLEAAVRGAGSEIAFAVGPIELEFAGSSNLTRVGGAQPR